MKREEHKTIEDEANHFALMLLMPEKLFKEDMKRINLVDDTEIKELAKKYGVSIGAIIKRAAIYKKYNN